VPVVVAAVLVILAVILTATVLVPLALVQRYRAGTARRRARRWLVTINISGISISTVLLLTGAALSNIWVPQAFTYACLGLVAGMAVGFISLFLTHWEWANGELHYTPNRWLVLAITSLVAARIAFGFWRTWHVSQSLGGSVSWAAVTGVAESLSAGAVILGYYLVYWLGILRRSGAPLYRYREVTRGRPKPPVG
jgi:hypothetical protein